MRIGDRIIQAGEPPYIIAEIGVNHDGSIDRAIELVGAAANVGADAIKLQLFQTDLLLSRAAKLAAYQEKTGERDPFDMLRRLELSIEQMEPIVHAAHHAKLHAIVTVFSLELVPHANRLEWDAYKVASPDIINRPLIESLMSAGLPLLLSGGAANVEEVVEATRWIGNHPHVLMQCVSSYPAADDCASLGGRIAMQRVNPNSLGYSDHTTAIDTGALAIASGACVLEKHLTYDRSAAGPDHAASLDPEGFSEYVRLAHRAHRMLGKNEKKLLDCERDVYQVARQSITAKHDLPADHALASGDLTVKRPGLGIEPKALNEIIGRRLKRAVRADMPLREEDLA